MSELVLTDAGVVAMLEGLLARGAASRLHFLSATSVTLAVLVLASPCGEIVDNKLVLARQADPEGARVLLRQAVQAARDCGEPALEAEAINQLATMANEHDGDPAAASAGYRDALALMQRAVTPPLHAMRGVRHNLAITLIYAGRPAEALALIGPLLDEACKVFRWPVQ